jgi:hypothetical protein
MVAPGSTGADFSVLLEFSLDEEANKRVEKRVSSIQDELRRIQAQAKKTGQALNESMQGVDKKADTAQKSVAKVGAELARLSARAKQSSKEINQGLDTTIRKLKQLEQAAASARQKAGLVSGAAARASSIFGQGLLLGGAVAGGILAESNRFAKEAEDAGRATQATREWTRATQELARARARVDNVLLKESLPLLQQAARIASQAAGFVEKHPEIIRASLNAGLVIAGLSAVGLAVSNGIKLVADATYIAAVATEMAAARLHKKAAEQELQAATAKVVTNRADDIRRNLGITPAGGGLVAGLNSTGGIIALATALLATMSLLAKGLQGLDNVIGAIGEKANASTSLVKTVIRDLDIVVGTALPLVPALKNFREAAARDIPILIQLFNRLTGATENAASAGARGSVGGRSAVRDRSSVTNTQLADVFGAWREDDRRMIQEAAANRVRILEDAERRIADITRNFASQRVAINNRFNDQRSSIITDYAQDLQRAEQDYNRNRAQIIQDAGEEIQRIEEQHQENIRKMTLEHNQSVADLTASRDALGLVKEERRFNQDRAEAERGTNREIAQRRRDTAQRLAELAEQFTLERAQRQQQFQQALADNERRRQEELKQAEIAHQEELKQARAAKEQQLRELQESLNAERIRRREVMIAQIRDLDAGLLGERNLKQQYYTLMLQDANNWMSQYRAALAAGVSAPTSTPGLASGGYANSGLYRLGETGQREFVLSGQSTKTAEKIIGNQLTQANLVNALSGINAGRSGTYIDQRRIDRPIGKDDKAMMQKIAQDALAAALGM